MQINEVSYEAHSNWYQKRFPDREQQLKAIDRWLEDQREKNINYWIHQQLFALAYPLCEDKTKTWLTVGDGYGFDANHLRLKGLDVTASDISPTFLETALERDLVEKFAIENVEKLSFQDNSFDYVFCKESYHHFPRPYQAVYEMLRVARLGVILIEPQDPISRNALLVALREVLDRFDTTLMRRIWKNQYSFEEVGNYVFKLSVREMEKLANGIGLPSMAVKGINTNFYKPEIHHFKADRTSKEFRKILRKKRVLDFLSSITLIPEQVISVILFKVYPDAPTQTQLKQHGYRLYPFPANPYLPHR